MYLQKAALTKLFIGGWGSLKTSKESLSSVRSVETERGAGPWCLRTNPVYITDRGARDCRSTMVLSFLLWSFLLCSS
ncbi:hypothetical protein FQN60_018675 [Etheostoma spectabile]|uniref:Uncharacterized protein n=1 Tax=Etheostoma spectabile TaxID=54343 RepID=A0A5J5CCZ7_9PERO|nr:hypothetical protein FQN60_018675 [Etheostoma spectabile]